MENQGFQQMINTPTRITENYSTLVNHQYCSHHNPTTSVRKQNANLKFTKKAHFTVTYRPLKKLNADSLIKDLNEIP